MPAIHRQSPRKICLHLVPSGIFYPHTTCIIGNGVVLNPCCPCSREMDDLKAKGVNDFSRLFITDRTNLIMPYHLLLEQLEEKALGSRAIGTTGKGIGPAFTDKVARYGIRAGDLLNPAVFQGAAQPGDGTQESDHYKSFRSRSACLSRRSMTSTWNMLSAWPHT